MRSERTITSSNSPGDYSSQGVFAPRARNNDPAEAPLGRGALAASGYWVLCELAATLLRKLSQECLDGLRVHRLREVPVETRKLRTILVFFLSPARQCDEQHRAPPTFASNGLRHLITRHARHSDIEQ